MAKFKKGDRVRRIYGSHNKMQVGDTATVIDVDEVAKCVRLDKYQEYAGLHDVNNLELLTEYTPITPKVGERYRVLKKGLKYYNGNPADELVGQIITYLELYRGNYQIRKESGFEQTLSPSTFTTEYLELVEEADDKCVVTGPGMLSGLECHVTSESPTTLRATYRVGLDFAGWHEEPIKKTIIQKTMNAFKKALLSADTKTLIKAGYMDDETLELTSKGQQALNFIVYEKYQKELVAAADADIKEAEAKKK